VSKGSYPVIILLVLSTILRLLIGSVVELGNDEVYYITYALYPDLSHFDHPPMIGWLIQLFTLNLNFDSEGWIRLAAIVSGTLSTLIIYHIGVKLGDKVTGWYAAILYNISVYGFVITGIFIMPDSPQMVFWLLSLLFLVIAIENDPFSSNNNSLVDSSSSESGNVKILDNLQSSTAETAKDNTTAFNFMLAGLVVGLALLSKYTSVFLLLGTLLYFMKYRYWFKKWYIYASALIALLCFVPVLVWNVRNDFISFTFHSDRVEVGERLFRLDSFGTELIGQILYNNPIVFALIVLALIALYRKKLVLKTQSAWLLVLIAIPFILLFLTISLFRSTLPHWTGPAYVTLIPLAALWLRQRTLGGKRSEWFPGLIKVGAGFIAMVIIAALLQIFYGVFLNKGIDPVTGKRLGIKDITLDMYGWKHLGTEFEKLHSRNLEDGTIDSSAVIVSHRWFPAANLDYYVARPLSMKVLTLAPLERAHKYAWITNERGGFKLGMDAYFISSSYDFDDPRWHFSDYYSISKPDTIPIYRQDLLVKYYYVWIMSDLHKLPPDYLTADQH